jgi:hypothetical protein
MNEADRTPSMNARQNQQQPRGFNDSVANLSSSNKISTPILNNQQQQQPPLTPPQQRLQHQQPPPQRYVPSRPFANEPPPRPAVQPPQSDEFDTAEYSQVPRSPARPNLPQQQQHQNQYQQPPPPPPIGSYRQVCALKKLKIC